MLKLIVSADVPKPIEARRHVANQQPVAAISSQAGLASLRRGAALSRSLNQSTVGIDSPGGDSGTTDLGSAGAAAQVASAMWGGDAA